MLDQVIEQIQNQIDALSRRLEDQEIQERPDLPYRVYYFGAKNIGDNVATGIFKVGVAAGQRYDGLIRLTLFVRSSAALGYSSVSQTLLISMRNYLEGVTPYLGSAVATLGTANAGSHNAGFSAVNTPGVTTLHDTINREITVRVQSDHTGTFAGSVFCDWWAEVFTNLDPAQVPVMKL